MSGISLSLHPGALPTRPEPRRGCIIAIRVEGLPPYKDFKSSIRNPRNRIHDRFLRLRECATKAMNGQRWSDSSVSLRISIYAPSLEKGKQVIEYVGGIMDTLGGSHGQYFTYLPIVYQDDAQVSVLTHRFRKSAKTHYVVKVEFGGARSFLFKR
jgi:hypothetical protein